jgi:dihydrofolate reductase
MSNQSNRVIAVAFTTLDGVVEDPDGSWGTPFGGWGFDFGPQVFAGDKFQLGPILETGALLFGRSTWQLFAQRWPTRTDSFATAMNQARKHVASRTLDSVEAWSNSVLLQLDLADAVEQLRADGDVVIVGSTEIVHQLAARGLIDEYRLLVLPTVVGTGARLFDGTGARLQLTSADAGDPGLLLRYDVVHDAATEPVSR